MKKNRILCLVSAVAIAAVGITSACNDDLDKLWNNPNQYTPAPDEVVSGLFSHIQKTRFWIEDYGWWWWMLGDDGTPQLIQVTGGFAPRTSAGGDGMYATPNEVYFDIEELAGNYPLHNEAINTGQTRELFEKFYTDLTNYGLIRDEVEALTGAERTNNEIYLLLATALKDIVAMRTVDLYNSIPYSNAFAGSKGIFFASYDDPKDIYKSALTELQDISGKVENAVTAMSDAAKLTFNEQDMFFKGDVAKWKRYLNGEILRFCTRVSGVAIDGFDRTAVMNKAIADGLITDGSEDYLMLTRETNHVTMADNNGTETLSRALYERWTRISAPDLMMVRMNRGTVKYQGGIDDPRLPVMFTGFTPTASATDIEFYGSSANKIRNRKMVLGTVSGESARINRYPYNPASGESINIMTSLPSTTLDMIVQGFSWSNYNPITYFLRHPYWFNIQTRADIDLLLAEYKNDGKYIEDAVKHSCEYWYKINGEAVYTDAVTPLAQAILQPDKNDADIAQYAATIKSEWEAAGADDKMEILMQQKYIHLNLHGVHELFAELRRTRHPKIEPLSWPSSTGGGDKINQKMEIERYRYPDSERTNNAEEYQKVSSSDNWTTPIFWATKSSESYFMNASLKSE
ncbi:hypothetical protein FACS189452_01760 [Bacteroidia bacterium]|nr:hypothetical protein FACS189452_01760 [Bacteroidia bacterium]